MKKTVVVAMSGGIDSSVVASLLKEQGYEVVGLTFVMFDNEQDKNYHDFVNDAKIVADMLEIKHFTLDIRKEFNSQIIDYFVNSYLSGRTPNPCTLCNPTIKFKHLIDFADSINFDYVATGHYAIINTLNDRMFFSLPADAWKDQTYFLWDLPQEYLKRTLMPLGSFTKDKVKELAEERGFTHLVHKRESYDVCFIRGKDYKQFIAEYLKKSGNEIQPGDIVTEDGKVVGKHNGITHYTIGQRRGLGVAMGEPYFVKKIDKENNRIIIAPRKAVSDKTVIIKNVNIMKYKQISDNQEFNIKVRYRDKGHKGLIKIDNDTAEITFNEPVFGVAPGQSAVFYDDNNDLVGGGIIA